MHTHLIASVDADGQALGQLQEGDVQLLGLPSPVSEVAVAVVPRHADLSGLYLTISIIIFLLYGSVGWMLLSSRSAFGLLSTRPPSADG